MALREYLEEKYPSLDRVQVERLLEADAVLRGLCKYVDPVPQEALGEILARSGHGVMTMRVVLSALRTRREQLRTLRGEEEARDVAVVMLDELRRRRGEVELVYLPDRTGERKDLE